MRIGIRIFFTYALLIVSVSKVFAEPETDTVLAQSRFVSDLRGFLEIDQDATSFETSTIIYQRQNGRISLRINLPDEFKNSLSYLMRVNDTMGLSFRHDSAPHFWMAETIDPQTVPGVLSALKAALRATLATIEFQPISELPFAPKIQTTWSTRQELLSSYPQVYADPSDVETAFAFYADLLTEAFAGLNLIDAIRVSGRYPDARERGSGRILATFSHTVKGVDLSGGKVMGPFYDKPIKSVILARILGKRPANVVQPIRFERTSSGSVFHPPDGRIVWSFEKSSASAVSGSSVPCQKAMDELNKGKPSEFPLP